MLRTLYLLTLVLLLPVAAQAQTLTGRVADADLGTPLPGANLFVPALQTGTATDADGRFRLALPRAGTYRVVFSFLGYRSETRTVTLADGQDVRLDVLLTPTEVEAPAVTVTAKAQASDILATPQAVAVVEGRALEENRGLTVFDALDETPGVRTVDTGVGVAKPMIRGLSSQRVLVIQNGVRQEGQQWGDEHGPELDAFDADRIEVVKGAASLLYGSDALGGVIQVTSDAGLFDHDAPLTGELDLQTMTNPRMGGTHLGLGGRTGAWHYDASVSAKRSGSYASPGRLIPNTGLAEGSGAVRLGRRVGQATVLAEYQAFRSRLGFFEPDALEAAAAPDRFTIGEPYQRVAHDRLRLRADVPTDAGRWEVTGSWQQNRRREFGHHHGEVHDEDAHHDDAHHDDAHHDDAHHDEPGHEEEDHDEHGEDEAALYLRLNTATVDARFHHRPMGRLFGTLGVSGMWQRNETLAEEHLVPGADTWNAALYLAEEWALPGVTVNGGLRYDVRQVDVLRNDDLGVAAQTDTYTAFSGALGAAWQPGGGLSFAFNAGRAWRAPALIERFGDGVHEGTLRFERGDAGLRPERSVSLDATARLLRRYVYLEVTGFTNHLDDYIFVQPTGAVDEASGFAVYQYTQAPARLWGGEFRADLHPHPLEWLHFHLSGDLTRSRNRETDQPLPFTPPARLQVEASLTADAFGPFRDARLRFGPTVTAAQDDVGPLETPTDGYTLWSAAVSAEVPAGGVVLRPSLAVDNLLDTAYTAHLSRFKPFGVLNPGRSLRLHLTVDF